MNDFEIEYVHFVCPQGELNDKLNDLGKDAWRLCTCEPLVRQSPDGSVEVYAFVVMDHVAYSAEDQQKQAEDSEASEGIRMKG